MVVSIFILHIIFIVKFRKSASVQNRKKFLAFLILFLVACVVALSDIAYNVILLNGIQNAYENSMHRDIPGIANIFFIIYIVILSISLIILLLRKKIIFSKGFCLIFYFLLRKLN